MLPSHPKSCAHAWVLETWADPGDAVRQSPPRACRGSWPGCRPPSVLRPPPPGLRGTSSCEDLSLLPLRAAEVRLSIWRPADAGCVRPPPQGEPPPEPAWPECPQGAQGRRAAPAGTPHMAPTPASAMQPPEHGAPRRPSTRFPDHGVHDTVDASSIQTEAKGNGGGRRGVRTLLLRLFSRVSPAGTRPDLGNSWTRPFSVPQALCHRVSPCAPA